MIHELSLPPPEIGVKVKPIVFPELKKDEIKQERLNYGLYCVKTTRYFQVNLST